MSIIYAFDEVKTLESMTEIERDILRRVEIIAESDLIWSKYAIDIMRSVGKYAIGFCDARSVDLVIKHYEEKLAESKGEQ